MFQEVKSPELNIMVMRGEGLARQQMLAQAIGEVFTPQEVAIQYPAGSLSARLAIAQASRN